jgi:hypothetical protein
MTRREPYPAFPPSEVLLDARGSKGSEGVMLSSEVTRVRAEKTGALRTVANYAR